MIKKYTFLITFVLYTNSIFSQLNYNWAINPDNLHAVGGNLDIVGVKTNESGNVFIAGNFSGTADFDPGPGEVNRTANGGQDFFFAKFNSYGDLLFVKTIHSETISKCNSFTIDKYSNIYLTGYFGLNIDFDPSNSLAEFYSTSSDIFIAKYDSSGNYKFALTFGDEFGDYGKSIVTDSNCNIYLAGEFTGIVDFDPSISIFELSSSGGIDIFLAKYDSAGIFISANRIGGGLDEECMSIIADDQENIFITGVFYGTCDFDPSITTYNLISGGSRDIFYAKYNVSGGLEYANRIGGVQDEYSQSICIDQNGNVFITGFFLNTVDFNPGAGTFNLTSLGSSDLFFAKYDSNGGFLFAKRIGGTGVDNSQNISLNNSGNILITGGFEGVVDFDPGISTVNLSSAGQMDIFIASYDPLGNFILAKKASGPQTDVGSRITSDVEGNIIFVGSHYNTTDFDPASGPQSITAGIGCSHGFICKYNSTGDFIWIDGLGKYGNIQYSEEVNSVKLDSIGNIYITGYYSGVVDFDQGVGNFYLSEQGLKDGFLAKYSSNGDLVFAVSFGGPSFQEGMDLQLDSSGNIIVVGAYRGTIEFNTGSGFIYLNSAGSNDIFLSKFDPNGNCIFAKSIGGTGDDYVFSVVLDPNINITGRFASTVDFDPDLSSFNLISAGQADAFVASYNLNGNLRYAIAIAGLNNQSGHSITSGDNGDLFVTGNFNGTADFDPSGAIQNLTSNGAADIFIARYDSLGNYIFSKNIGGTSDELGEAIVVSKNNDIYLTGYLHSASSDFDPGIGVSLLSTHGYRDIFIAKYDSLGNFIFANNIGGSNFDVGVALKLDDQENIYITGQFSHDSVDFDPGIDEYYLYTPYQAMYIAKYDSLGNFIYAVGNTGNSNCIGKSIAIDSFEQVIVVGDFIDSVDLDFGINDTILTSFNTSGFYIAKYIECNNPEIPIITTSNNNPCILFTDTIVLSIASSNLNDASYWQWYSESCGGNAIDTGVSISINQLEATSYFVRGEGGCASLENCAMITLGDTIGPNLICPSDILINPNQGNCFATNISLGTPNISDNCSINNTQNNFTDSLPVGVHSVLWSSSDINGNVSTCIQTVTVESLVFPNLGNDLNLCYGSDSISVTPGNFYSYLWSSIPSGGIYDNTTNNLIIINSTQFSIGTYLYFVEVTDSNGCIGIDTIIINYNDCTGINTFENINFPISIYPNPTNDLLNVQVSFLPKFYQINYSDGVLIERRTINSSYFNINTSLFQPGVYILTITSEDGIISCARFIKINY